MKTIFPRKAQRLSQGGLGLVAILFSAASLRADQAPAHEATIELPAFVVNESRPLPPPESWRYAEGSGFEVLTQGASHRVQEVVQDFALFRQCLDIVLPSLQPKPALPLLFIFCADAQFDGFAPVTDQGDPGSLSRSTYLLRDAERSIVVLNLGTQISNGGIAAELDPLVDRERVVGIENDHARGLRREYVRSLYARMEPRLPAWMEEGFVQLIMDMEFDRKSIRFAELEEPTTDRAPELRLSEGVDDVAAQVEPVAQLAVDRDFNIALARAHLMPLAEMLAVKHDPAGSGIFRGYYWGKQSAAFLHLCLYGKDKRFQKGFFAYQYRIAREPLTEALFTECFGLDYKAMLMELRLYISAPLYEAFRYTAKDEGLKLPPALELRAATQSEIGRIKGEALLFGGHDEAGRVALTAPYIRGERDPRLLASLGLAERAAGRDDRARKFLEAAATLEAVRPRAHLELARLRFAEALARPTASGKLDATQAAFVRRPLLTARSQPPPLVEVYELFAEIWEQSAAGPTPEQLALLEEGVNLFPNHLALIYRTAAWEIRVGRFEQAKALVDFGLAAATTRDGKARFTALRAKLPSRSTP